MPERYEGLWRYGLLGPALSVAVQDLSMNQG